MLELFRSYLASPLLFSSNSEFDFICLTVDVNQILYLNVLILLTGKGRSKSDA